MTPIRTGYSLFDKLGLNNPSSRDLSLYVEDKNGNRIRIGSPVQSSNRPNLLQFADQNTNLSSAINDLMRNMFGLPQDQKSEGKSGDMKLEYTTPNGTKVKLDIDAPDKPQVEEKKPGCSNDMSHRMDKAVDKMMEDMGLDTEDAKQSDFEKAMEASLKNSAKDAYSKSMDTAVDKMMEDMGLDTEDAKQSDFEKAMETNLKKSMQDSYSNSMDDAVNAMMKDMGFDTEASQQSEFEQDIEQYFADSIESSMQDSYTDNLLNNVLSNMFGEDSYDQQDFSPWSPWGNSLFSSYNPYLSSSTFPASYAYAQMLGEWMLSNQRPVYNPNQTFQGGYKF